MHVLVPKDNDIAIEYFLGLLNSKLLNFYYQGLNPEIGEALAEVKKENVAQLHIRNIDFSKPDEVKKHYKMVYLSWLYQWHMHLLNTPQIRFHQCHLADQKKDTQKMYRTYSHDRASTW